MTIFDLLSNLAKGDEMPFKIFYDGVNWTFDDERRDYYSDEWLFSNYLAGLLADSLNEEVYPQKNDAPCEKKEFIYNLDGVDFKSTIANNYSKSNIQAISHELIKYINETRYKLNEIIDKINGKE